MDGELDSLKEDLLVYFNDKKNIYECEINELEEENFKINIEIMETRKIIDSLKKSMDNSQDIFSPIETSIDFNSDEILNLNKIMEKLNDDIKNNTERINTNKEKIDEVKKQIININKIYMNKKNDANSKNNNIELTDTINTIKDKVEFCRKICISDSNRCGLELKKISEILDKLSI